jgi:peptidyl-tRNA hydrolase, PTH1 family
MVVALLADRHGERLRHARNERSLVAEAKVGDRRLALAFPQTYMNDSGVAVRALVRRFGIEDLARLVIVQDELDLPTGTVRVKAGGGLAGHNGLRSIEAHLHDRGFTRIRLGIDKAPGRNHRPGEGIGHVLGSPSKRDQADLDAAVETAADAVEHILAQGVDSAMTIYNAR